MLEFLFKLVRCLAGNLPGACSGWPLAAFASEQPERAFAAPVLAGIPISSVRALGRMPDINAHDGHGLDPSDC